MITNKRQFIKWTFKIFLKLFVAGHHCRNSSFACSQGFPRFPPLVSTPLCSSIPPAFLLPPHSFPHASRVMSAHYFSLVLLPVPHLPASRFSNTSRKPKLLSPLVDCYDGSTKSGMNGKMIDLPYVGKIQNLDSTGFISRLCKVVCYSNCRLFWLLYSLFTYTAYNSYKCPFSS